MIYYDFMRKKKEIIIENGTKMITSCRLQQISLYNADSFECLLVETSVVFEEFEK